MKTNIRLLWHYLETRYAKILRIFGIKQDTSVIPYGMYCYAFDKERNEREPIADGGIWIKTCKYHRSTPKTGGVACTYVGHFGFDLCLYDQCKICGKNEYFDEGNLN